MVVTNRGNRAEPSGEEPQKGFVEETVTGQGGHLGRRSLCVCVDGVWALVSLEGTGGGMASVDVFNCKETSRAERLPFFMLFLVVMRFVFYRF